MATEQKTNQLGDSTILPSFVDLQIMNFINKWPVVSPSHVASHFNISLRLVNTHLQKLYQMNAVQRIRADSSGTYVYRIDEGASAYLADKPERYNSIRKKSLNHDLLLTSFGMIYQKNFEHVHTEREFMRNYYSQFGKSAEHAPDLIVEHPRSSELLAVEIELSVKNQFELAKIISFYSRYCHIMQVLYITTSSLASYLQLNMTRHVNPCVRIMICRALDSKELPVHQEKYKLEHYYTSDLL